MKNGGPAAPDIEEVMDEGAKKPYDAEDDVGEHHGIRVGPIYPDEHRSASMEAQPRTPPKAKKTPKKKKTQKKRTQHKKYKKAKQRKHERSDKPSRRNM